ncbi:MAG: hypothetical protein OHK0046_33930 [Anaerolineae bacterium]
MSTLDWLEQSEQAPRQRRFTLSLGSLLLISGIIVVCVVVGMALYKRQNDVQPTKGTAPDFTLTTFDNETLNLSDLRGKVVVLNFWASWCEPCRIEAPELQATWEKYQNRDDVVFLGVAYADNGPRSMEFIEQYGLTYMNGPDLGTRISELYSIQGVPETFIIDQEGRISRFIFNRVSETQLTLWIDELLEA